MSKMFDNASESRVSALQEASTLVRRIAEPVPAGDSVKAALKRVLRRLPNTPNWTHSRVRSLWYGDRRCKVSGDELNELRRVARKTVGSDELGKRIARLEAWAARTDPEFFGPSVDALRSAYERIGCED